LNVSLRVPENSGGRVDEAEAESKRDDEEEGGNSDDGTPSEVGTLDDAGKDSAGWSSGIVGEGVGVEVLSGTGAGDDAAFLLLKPSVCFSTVSPECRPDPPFAFSTA
jgi:hypothetical protein